MNVTLLTRLHGWSAISRHRFRNITCTCTKGKQKYLARFHFPPRMKFPRETFRHVLIKQEELFNRTLANFRSFLRVSRETCPRKGCVFIFFVRVNLKKKFDAAQSSASASNTSAKPKTLQYGHREKKENRKSGTSDSYRGE